MKLGLTKRPVALVLFAAVVVCGGIYWRQWSLRAAQRKSVAQLAQALPWPREDDSFVTSAACQECHSEQYRSWHASYHRTMTQAATPETVRADFNDVTLESNGYSYRLSRRGDEFWVELPDLDWATHDSRKPLTDAAGPRTERRAVMITGSHHFQEFWLAMGDGNVLMSLPFAYLLEDRRWAPRDDVFLTSFNSGTVHWNDNCVNCHSVAPVPRAMFKGDVHEAASRVVELGIACESCHGKGESHVRWHKEHPNLKPNGADPTIVLPSALDHVRSAQVCGQCHGLTVPRDAEAVNDFGSEFAPGGDLNQTRHIVRQLERLNDETARQAVWDHFRGTPGGISAEFWDDGAVRVVGREYNGLVESGCFQRGDLSCLSCHSMHNSDPNDQLVGSLAGNRACLQCHGEYQEKLAAHTHHAADSVGSQCYNCHMPNTTYGLLKFTRSHRIDSPTANQDAKAGRPNACVLCHFDQTLEWSAKHLQDWYGQEPPPLDEAQRSLAGAVAYMLTGDACQRALLAWHTAWPPARAAGGERWTAPLLTQLLTDPFSAVRYQAIRGLNKSPGFDRLEYDYVAPVSVRQTQQTQAWEAWRRVGPATDRHGPALLLDEQGVVQTEPWHKLLGQRNDRPMHLAE